MSVLKLKDLYDGFRDPDTMRSLAKQISQEAAKLSEPLRIMEVCGGHTHTIMKYALPQLLPDNISFIHGPGCPVCIMPKERIDHAIALVGMEDTILLTLGDMIRVPGSKTSLAKERAEALTKILKEAGVSIYAQTPGAENVYKEKKVDDDEPSAGARPTGSGSRGRVVDADYEDTS